MNVKMRQEVERKIARRFVLDAIAAGYLITVDNGGEEPELEKSKDAKAVLKAMFATDDEKLFLFRPGTNEWTGWVWFVYGNDGYDVISNYTTNLEDIMVGADKISDRYA